MASLVVLFFDPSGKGRIPDLLKPILFNPSSKPMLALLGHAAWGEKSITTIFIHCSFNDAMNGSFSA